MVEVAENTSVETGSEETVSETVAFNGNLGEGWMEQYGVHEDLRGNQGLQCTKTVASMASQLVNAQNMVGKNVVPIPNADSPQTEWDAFHDNFRPSTAGDYAIEHAEGVGEIDAVAEGAFKEFVHAEGLRPSTVQKLSDMHDQYVINAEAIVAKAEEQKFTDCETALKKQWGAAFEERKALANRMISENVSDENKGALLDYMGTNPFVADFLANIAAKFVEHKIIDATLKQNTPGDALAKADDLRSTPGYIDGTLANTSPARYKQITADISALMEEAYPEQK